MHGPRPLPAIHDPSGPAGAPLLSVRSLRKTLPGGRILFDGLNLTLARGEFVAIKGESGAGKTTLLNLIAGIDVADGGHIILDGIEMSALDEDSRTRLRRTHMGFVFQAFHILPHLTLTQNVALPLLLQKVSAQDAIARALEMLASTGLPERGDDYPQALSGGELQRVAIARALVHRPALILADEPTGNLDPEAARRIIGLFSAQVRESGAAVLLVTHSSLAAAAADRQLTLNRTGLAASGNG